MWTTTGCASSCGEDAQHVTAIGELNNGEFGYRCVGATDPFCAPVTAPPQFPDCILVGGRFDLDYQLRDESALFDADDASLLYVAPASETYFSAPVPSVALRVGHAAMLARTDDNVVDIFHFDLVPPETIGVYDMFSQQPLDELTLAVDDVAVLSILGETTACYAPAGALPLQIASADRDVAIADTTGEVVRVTGLRRGTTTLTITLGSLREQLLVVVGPSEDDTGLPATTEGGGTSAGTSDGSETDGSGGTSTGDGTTGDNGTSGTTGGM